MKHITNLGAGGDETAAFLYWDEDRNIDKLIIVNNKRASVVIKVECLDKVVKEIEIGSYETFGVFVENWMKDEKIWVTVTYHGNISGCIGYKWSIGGLYG